jgi:DNA helicase-2/ATP-dependent DNA helicase PcrA
VALTQAGIPVASALRAEVLERTGLRAALAYLRIAVAPDGSIAGRDVVEILRRPSRGLPPWFADRVRRRSRWAQRGLTDLARTVPEKDAPKVEDLADDLGRLRSAAGGGATTRSLLQLVREDIGLGGAMGLLDRSRGGEGSSHLDDLDALEQVADLWPDPTGFEDWLRDRLASGSAGSGEGVTLSTVHRVKGMEWDRVALYGVSGGILPHRLAEDEEEERRVLHVAITRGREEVVVLSDRSRPSPFLAELDGSAPKRKAGASADRSDRSNRSVGRSLAPTLAADGSATPAPSLPTSCAATRRCGRSSPPGRPRSWRSAGWMGSDPPSWSCTGTRSWPWWLRRRQCRLIVFSSARYRPKY